MALRQHVPCARCPFCGWTQTVSYLSTHAFNFETFERVGLGRGRGTAIRPIPMDEEIRSALRPVGALAIAQLVSNGIPPSEQLRRAFGAALEEPAYTETLRPRRVADEWTEHQRPARLH